jgi:hypothetical protein
LIHSERSLDATDIGAQATFDRARNDAEDALQVFHALVNALAELMPALAESPPQRLWLVGETGEWFIDLDSARAASRAAAGLPDDLFT